MKVLFSVFILLPLLSFCQSKNEISSLQKVDNRYEISEIIKLDSTTVQAHLYANSKEYFSTGKGLHLDTVLYDDQQKNLIAKCSFAFTKWNQTIISWYENKFKVEFKVEIVSSDSQYRYRFFDIIVNQLSSGSSMYGPVTNVQLWINDIDTFTKKGAQKKFYQKVRNEIETVFEKAKNELKNKMKMIF